MRKIIISIFLLSISAHLLAAEDPCAEGTYFDDRLCADAKLGKADAELNSTYKELMSLIPKVYKQPKSENGEASSEEVKNAMVKAQKSWIKFRDDQCSYEFETARGGTGTLASYAGNVCAERLTSVRVNELKTEIKNLKHTAQ